MADTHPPAASHHQSRRGLISLIVVNAVLLLVLVSSLASPYVQAQLGRRSNFLMVAGEGERTATNIVWILESRNGELITIDWADAGQGMNAKAHRNVQRDIAAILKARR
ncbi:MAG: hypothetical protein P8K80_01610 [Phycisphaerales bacterium]|nr:hypothetical protein [Phycisphaerales bacterium]